MEKYWLTPVVGGVAGLTADVLTHPISTVKTRMQVQGADKSLLNQSLESQSKIMYRNPFQAAFHMVKHEGVGSFWQGIGAVIGGAPFASALYFGGVEGSKTFLRRNGSSSAVIDFTSGVMGQLCGSLAWVPMDVLKERCQIQGQIHTNINYNNTIQALRSIIKSEGVLGIYRAYWIHQLTWAPFNGCYWMIYEKAKGTLTGGAIGDIGSTSSFVISSCIAGTVASVVTSPLDLVKTRMQVQMANPTLFPFDNSWQCAKLVMKNEGVLAFFDGLVARCCWLTPRYVIAVSLFDTIKHALSADSASGTEADLVTDMQS